MSIEREISVGSEAEVAAAARFAQYDTQDIWQKDKDHFIHPWTDFSTFQEQGSLVVAESEGAYIFDSDGKRYLDGIGGLWCVNVGYGRAEIGRAMAEQATKMTYYSSFGHHTTIPVAELSAKLASLAPGPLNHVLYGSGGSMANDTTVRLVHFYFNQLGMPDKKMIITRENGYHGSTYLAMSMTGIDYDHIGFDVIGEPLIQRVSGPDLYRRPEGTTPEEYTDLLLAEFRAKVESLGPQNVAAFFAEPIMGAGGVLVPPPGYLKGMRDLCTEFQVLFVADEVVTAFGRLGHFFASEDVFGIVPDIINSAKGLTSAYAPLSATLISDGIYDVISVPQAEGSVFAHGFTYSGHPVCCAAALANIEIIEREDICGHVRRVGPYFSERLASLSDLGIVGDVRGSHFMQCVENVADKETKELFDPSVHVGDRVAGACEKRGLIVRPIAHLNVLSPPLVLTVEQIDWMVDVLRDGIIEVQADLVAEGLWNPA
ncbi:MAG: aminotransferase [Acidimicrobiales bacterium]|jgi:adenosylmethionine-8-amino-7-oxononanoate aminotransferase|nr:aminotransferase [Acidimicrobiia bacterium]